MKMLGEMKSTHSKQQSFGAGSPALCAAFGISIRAIRMITAVGLQITIALTDFIVLIS